MYKGHYPDRRLVGEKRSGASFRDGASLRENRGRVNGSTRNRIYHDQALFEEPGGADSTRLQNPDNINRECDLKTWVPGCGLATSVLSPIVYTTTRLIHLKKSQGLHRKQ
jgi:hypothetical protein